MLIPNQHLCKSHTILVSADYYHPATECDLLQYWVEKLLAWLGIEPKTLDLSSQSGAYDLSTTEKNL